MDERFRKGLAEFNSRDFFEAHEVWEDLWHEYRETDRTFLQALIQIAAGLYHLDCGNVPGARSQISKGLKKLEQYRPSHKGVDVQALAGDVESCMGTIGEHRSGEPDQPHFPVIRYSENQT